MHARTTLIIGEQDIGAIVSRVGIDRLMDDMIAALERAFADYGSGATAIQKRTGFVYDAPEPGLVEFMPAMRRGRAVALKVVGYHPNNPTRRGMPTIVATNSLYDATTGHLDAVVDGTFATALRTGAASAVASMRLADPSSQTLGIIGTGAQAVTQLHALSRCFRFERVLVHDIDDRHAASFARRAAFAAMPIEVLPKRDVVSQSDILVVATSNGVGAPPVVALGPHRRHLHINAVGSDIPGKVEIAAALLRRCFVVPDYLHQARVEGECQQLEPAEIGPELHQLVKQPLLGCQFVTKPTVFDSTGNPLEDLAVTELLVGHAERLGLGQRIAIESGLCDALDPYRFAPAAAAPARRAS